LARACLLTSCQRLCRYICLSLHYIVSSHTSGPGIRFSANYWAHCWEGGGYRGGAQIQKFRPFCLIGNNDFIYIILYYNSSAWRFPYYACRPWIKCTNKIWYDAWVGVCVCVSRSLSLSVSVYCISVSVFLSLGWRLRGESLLLMFPLRLRYRRMRYNWNNTWSIYYALALPHM